MPSPFLSRWLSRRTLPDLARVAQPSSAVRFLVPARSASRHPPRTFRFLRDSLFNHPITKSLNHPIWGVAQPSSAVRFLVPARSAFPCPRRTITSHGRELLRHRSI